MPLVSGRGLQSHPRLLTPILTVWSFVMKWILQPGMLVLLFALTSTQAMSFSGNIGIFLALPRIAIDAKSGINPDIVNTVNPIEAVGTLKNGAGFVISK